uniref:Uncharacterized protein n=1 Tax=viral metagenome TaxID=1070528 RepID=A0A6C0J8R7_9ZZZZ
MFIVEIENEKIKKNIFNIVTEYFLSVFCV